MAPQGLLHFSNPFSSPAPCSLAPAAPSHSPFAVVDSVNIAVASASVSGFAAANVDS